MFVRGMGLWPPVAVMLDSFVPITAQALGMALTVTVYLSLAIILGEGLVMRWLDYTARWRAIWGAAVAMNAASTVAGVVLYRYLDRATDGLAVWLARIRSPANRGPAETLSDRGALVDWFAAFAVLWLVTTLIEAAVLALVRRDGRLGRSLGHSAVVNVVSYVPLTIGLLFYALSSTAR